MKKLLIIMLCVFSSCLGSKIDRGDEITAIVFGGGGGFTGAYTTYTLMRNGELQKNGKNLRKIKRHIASDIFKEAATLLPYEYYKPDNMSQFIEIKTNAKTYRYVWGFGTNKIDKKVKGFYKQLNKLNE